jgi:hypothetical protein
MDYKIRLFFFLILLLTLNACSNEITTFECNPIDNGDNYNKCLFELAVEQGNLDICEKIQSYHSYTSINTKNCYEAVVIAKNDPKLCNKIKNDESDVRTCLSTIAKNKKDYEICLEINSYENEKSYTNSKYGCLADVGELKDDIALCVLSENSNCFINVAKDKNKTKYCNLYSDVSQMNLCRTILDPNYGFMYPEDAFKKLDPELCGNNTNARSLCIREIANKLNDTNICNYEKDSYRRGRCFYLIIDTWEDWDKCSEINSIYYNQRCYEKIIPFELNYETNDSGFRSLIHSESYYLGKAKISLNYSYCKWIKDEEDSTNCFNFIANLTNDKSICNNINNNYDKQLCYLNIKIKEKNITFCDTFKNNYFKKLCIDKTMNLIQNKSSCDNFSTIEYKNICYRAIANKKNDLNLCKQINDLGIRVNCVKDIAFNLDDINLCKNIEQFNVIELIHDSQKSYSIKDVCYDEIAKKLNDITICEMIGDSSIAYLCKKEISKILLKFSKKKDLLLYSEAINSIDENICLQIKTENQRFECIQKIVLLKKDDLICKKIDNQIEKEICLRDIAIENQNKLLCKKIKNKFDREMCLREIAIDTSNEGLCKELTGVNKDICLHNFIVLDSDFNNCDKIKNEQLNLNCKINIAINNEDDTICYDLNIEDKNICLKNYASFHADNLSYCQKITDRDELKYYCYNTLTNKIDENYDVDFCKIGVDAYYDNCLSNLAKKKHDFDICNLINNTEDRDSCYGYNIVYNKKINICNKISNYSNSFRFSSNEECIAFILNENALDQKDVSLCDKIPLSNLSYKNSCYKFLAYELDNSQLCEKIDYIGDKDECYSSLCIENENLELCDHIKDSIFKDWSKTIIAINTNNKIICNTIIQDDFFKQECIKNIV